MGTTQSKLQALGVLQKPNDQPKHKFQSKDNVFIVDAIGAGVVVRIKEFTFNAYTDYTYKKATIISTKTHETVTIRSDAIFPTREYAYRFAIVYLIKRKKPTLKINNEMSVEEQYREIEENYPELILKHIKNISNL